MIVLKPHNRFATGDVADSKRIILDKTIYAKRIQACMIPSMLRIKCSVHKMFTSLFCHILLIFMYISIYNVLALYQRRRTQFSHALLLMLRDSQTYTPLTHRIRGSLAAFSRVWSCSNERCAKTRQVYASMCFFMNIDTAAHRSWRAYITPPHKFCFVSNNITIQ